MSHHTLLNCLLMNLGNCVLFIQFRIHLKSLYSKNICKIEEQISLKNTSFWYKMVTMLNESEYFVKKFLFPVCYCSRILQFQEVVLSECILSKLRLFLYTPQMKNGILKSSLKIQSKLF